MGTFRFRSCAHKCRQRLIYQTRYTTTVPILTFWYPAFIIRTSKIIYPGRPGKKKHCSSVPRYNWTGLSNWINNVDEKPRLDFINWIKNSCQKDYLIFSSQDFFCFEHSTFSATYVCNYTINTCPIIGE